ncbi:MAG: rhodanese-like domain-containing protein [Gammaproteobacteria bacterium]|nr:rhodanese-like domain-containing protein [Gammaproteobacteria bacterium]MDH5735040.1 rhodanese-like domain-containing protein [Gammaproteobacteria bacterium]
MSQFIEFANNHLVLLGAFVVVLTMIIKMEFESRFSGITQLSAADAVRLMNNDETIVIDVRESKEFSESHIKGATHIPMTAIKTRLNELEKYKDKPVLTYCRSGSRSNYACRVLKKAGFNQVNNLAGGVIGWESANLPLTRK